MTLQKVVIWIMGCVFTVAGCAQLREGEARKAASTTEARNAQLFYAISTGNQREAVKLIDAGADPNAREEKGIGLTALHRAAERGFKPVVEALVAKGAKLDVEAPSFRGTPLVLALAHGHEDIARLLITKGASARFVDSAGYTPLHVAARASSPQMVELLISKGANVNAASEIRRTPLYSALEAERWDNGRLLIEKGADFRRDIGGEENTALSTAARRGGKEFVEFLVAKGVDIRAKNALGLTALHYAAGYGYRDIAEFLITKGADVNASGYDVRGRAVGPPVMGAAYRGHFDVIKLLVAHGADPKVRRKGGGNAVSSAAFGGHREIVEWLVEQGAEVNPFDKDTDVEQGLHFPLFAAVTRRDMAMIRFLIAKGANVNAKAKNGETALRRARERHMDEVVALLVAHGAKE